MEKEADTVKFSLQEDRLQVCSTIRIQERFRKKHSALSYLAVMEPFCRLPETFRRLKKRSQIPLLGVNLGNLGFLAEVDRQSVYQALDKLTEDVYEVEERMMLSGTVYRGDRVIGKDIALNDIVIAREGPLRVVRFKNFVNDEYLNSYNADGIIISTPTGSTGYSLSVGGPIVSPSGEMTIMTPIAPHTLNSRSIVFPAEDVITVEMGEGRHQDCEKGLASFDGDSEIPMITGDKIVIRKAEVKTRILKLNHLSFVEVLRQKMRDS